MRKPRDYKAEYAKRQENARKAGFKNYGVQRKYRAAAKRAVDATTKRLDDFGLIEWMERIEDFDDLFSRENEIEFWRLVREYYDRGTA